MYKRQNLYNIGIVEASLDDLTNKDSYHWANYPLGVVWAFAQKGYKLKQGFDLVVWGNIPKGAGLSSSASLEVLTGVVLVDLFDIQTLSPVDPVSYTHLDVYKRQLWLYHQPLHRLS